MDYQNLEGSYVILLESKSLYIFGLMELILVDDFIDLAVPLVASTKEIH